MDMLHTPEEVVRLSNAAHVAEGVLLIILAAILLAQAFGYLEKSWQKYLLPALGLLASLTLALFLFVDHANELGRAWQAVMADMQQRQHAYMGVLIGFGSLAELISIKRDHKILRLVFPLAVAIIGLLFLIHPQHGTSELAERALLTHRIAGSSLIIAALAKAISVFQNRFQKILLIIAASMFIVSGALFIGYKEPPSDMPHNSSGSFNNSQTGERKAH